MDAEPQFMFNQKTSDMKPEITVEDSNIIMKHGPRYYGLSMIDFVETTRQHDTNEGMLRFYCTSFPDGWKLQIRALQPLLKDNIPNKKLKRRNLIANISISLDELEEILRLARESVTWENRELKMNEEDPREEAGYARIDEEQKKAKPTCQYAGETLKYFCTISENDHGNKALDIAQEELDCARKNGFQACCLHRDTEHDVYVSESFLASFEAKEPKDSGKVKFCDLKEGQYFIFPGETVIRRVQQIGKTEIYAPTLSQNTIGHSMEGGEEVFLKSDQMVEIVPDDHIEPEPEEPDVDDSLSECYFCGSTHETRNMLSFDGGKECCPKPECQERVT